MFNILRKLFIIFVSIGGFLANSQAQNATSSVGFAIHNGPALITSKFWISDAYAIDVAGTLNIQEDFSWIYLHSDFLSHYFDVVQIGEVTLPLYWGGGLKFTLGNNHAIGLRAPVGASYIASNNQFETFFELAPFFDLVESARFSLDGAIGFRLYL